MATDETNSLGCVRSAVSGFGFRVYGLGLRETIRGDLASRGLEFRRSAAFLLEGVWFWRGV